MSDEGERLYDVWSNDPLTYKCPCEFHQGEWKISTGKTFKGVTLTGNGCLASVANPPALTGKYGGKPGPIPLAGTSIWDRRFVANVRLTERVVAKTGYNCIRCNFKNDYACANHGPDAYLCFNCR